MNASVERWLVFAKEDLHAADILLKEGVYNQACFHSQQCIEKSIKGLYAHLVGVPPRTHSITDLLSMIPAELFADLKEGMESVDDYYIATRYPDALPGTLPEGLPGDNEAEQLVALARSVLARVLHIAT